MEGAGYPNASALLAASDEEILNLAAQAEVSRYNSGRNPEGRWLRYMHDGIADKHVLDFGCGFGLESLQLARRGNRITLVDINASSVRLAHRVLSLHGFGEHVAATVVASDRYPYFDSPAGKVDVFYACGVLHHLPYPVNVLARACEVLAPRGEIRLMLYTDKAWQVSTGSPAPPVNEDVVDNPQFEAFHRAFDCVGRYADWYSEERLWRRFGSFLDVTAYHELNLDGVYAAATLKPVR